MSTMRSTDEATRAELPEFCLGIHSIRNKDVYHKMQPQLLIRYKAAPSMIGGPVPSAFFVCCGRGVKHIRGLGAVGRGRSGQGCGSRWKHLGINNCRRFPRFSLGKCRESDCVRRN